MQQEVISRRLQSPVDPMRMQRLMVEDLQHPPADINQAGGLSPYGVMGITGNIAEWEESSFNTLNDDPTAARALMGGTGLIRAPMHCWQRKVVGSLVRIREASS